jgi:hypothetical protein
MLKERERRKNNLSMRVNDERGRKEGEKRKERDVNIAQRSQNLSTFFHPFASTFSSFSSTTSLPVTSLWS